MMTQQAAGETLFVNSLAKNTVELGTLERPYRTVGGAVAAVHNSDRRCGLCRHWEISDDWTADKIGMKRCAAIRARWKIMDEIAPKILEYEEGDIGDKWEAARLAALAVARAYVQDGSEYFAELITGPDFSCALFDPVGEK